MSISEAIKEIREKLETGGQDHGLFQAYNPKVGRPSRWLRGDRTLNFYGKRAVRFPFRFAASHAY